ncbi:MAG: DUF1707 domain-containing protein [Corynebacterium sp.]|nr:DUF1707 domain-containing protein [Corynebacterium sp.]
MSNEHVRISDAERTQAMELLGTHFAAGRLTLPEYEERCDRIVSATTRGEVTVLFRDLPDLSRLPATTSGRAYSVDEIEHLRKRNAKPKAGIVALTTIGTLGTVMALDFIAGINAPYLLFLIPAVIVLLYVMKIGPAAWHMPSPQQLEKERIRELRTRAKIRQIEMRQESRAKQHELANQAMNYAQGFLKKK